MGTIITTEDYFDIFSKVVFAIIGEHYEKEEDKYLEDKNQENQKVEPQKKLEKMHFLMLIRLHISYVSFQVGLLLMLIFSGSQIIETVQKEQETLRDVILFGFLVLYVFFSYFIIIYFRQKEKQSRFDINFNYNLYSTFQTCQSYQFATEVFVLQLALIYTLRGDVSVFAFVLYIFDCVTLLYGGMDELQKVFQKHKDKFRSKYEDVKIEIQNIENRNRNP